MLEILLDKPSQPTAADIIPVFQELQAEGIKVGLWKIEGLATAKEWQAVAPYAQAPMIILGRGQATEAVEKWIQAAAESGVVDGFAIGRTIFEAPLKSFVARQSTRVETVTAIATDYLRFIHIWETYV